MDFNMEEYIKHKLSNVEYGEVQFTIKKYAGKEVAAQAYESHSFKPEGDYPAAEIGEYILHKIKEYKDKNHNGTISFSVIFKGNPNRVIMNVVEQDD